ncbi:hypothetical protein BAE44_0016248, partial [Dichanthelium oligosanthes]
MNLKLLGRSLPLCWLWSNRFQETRSAFPVRLDPITEAFFNASISCEIGDGISTLFWTDPWLDGSSFAASMPELVAAVPARQRNRRTVASALQGQDRVRWKWCPSGRYSCSSAYQAFFVGQTALLGARELWKVKA